MSSEEVVSDSNHRKLIVWQKGMELVVMIYAITKNFPKEELYGLTSQIRRAAVSVPSNIAEGSRRKTAKDRSHFYSMALGSVSEVETQVEIARRLGYCEQTSSVMDLLDELARILNKLSQRI
jgi:four helix bundle protein